MKISNRGLDLIKAHEGCSLKAYVCPAGKLTIGYGHTGNVKTTDVITQEQANKFIADDCEWAEAVINGLVRVPLNQNQFDALCSFVFNVGPTLFRVSTLLRLINEYRFDQAALEFPRWKYAAGKELEGLKMRREAEQQLFSEKLVSA